MNAQQAEELYNLASKRNLVHMVAFSYRFVPAVKMLRELIKEEQAGKIYHVRCHSLQSWLSSPLAPYSFGLDIQEAGSGVLKDLGLYVFDLAKFLTGGNSSRCRSMPGPLSWGEKIRFGKEEKSYCG